MQKVEISKEQVGLKKRQRFMLRQSANLQIKRQSKKMNTSQNDYLIKSVESFLRAYKAQNIFFYDRAF